MNKEYHIFVCNSFRSGGTSRGVCKHKGARDILKILEAKLSVRGIKATVTPTGCLKRCENGPVMVIYPNGWWYGELDESKLDEILDALKTISREKTETSKSYFISD